MRIEGARKIHYDSGPNMTPLVDIVMVILIFLMLAGSFAADQRYLFSDIPIDTSGVGAAQEPQHGPIPQRLEVKLTQRAMPYACMIVNKEAHNLKEVSALFQQQVNSYKAANIDPQTVQVTLRTAADVRLDHLLTVYQAALEAGFKQVCFATLQ